MTDNKTARDKLGILFAIFTVLLVGCTIISLVAKSHQKIKQEKHKAEIMHRAQMLDKQSSPHNARGSYPGEFGVSDSITLKPVVSKPEDFNELSEKEIYPKIVYNNYRFEGNVVIGDNHFKDSLVVVRAKSNSGIFIMLSDFDKAVEFHDNDVLMQGFYGCRFYEEFNSSNCKEKQGRFENNQVTGNAAFKENQYRIEAIFSENIFYGNVSFRECFFGGRVRFYGTFFGGDSDFSNLKLTDSTRFDFDNVRLGNSLDFSGNSKIYNDIDLTTADFETLRFTPHYINLYKSDISKFHLDYVHFRLTKTYKKYYYNHNIPVVIEIPFDEMCGIYEGLLNNFRTRGQQESYKLLDIEYRDYKWRKSPDAKPWMSTFEREWWNYGYNRELIFKWSGVMLLFFTFVTFLFLPYFNKTYKLKKLRRVKSVGFKCVTVKEVVLRWWLSLVYSASIFFGLTLKIENIDIRRFWGTLYVVIMYSLGIICLAYMANYIIQK